MFLCLFLFIENFVEIKKICINYLFCGNSIYRGDENE